MPDPPVRMNTLRHDAVFPSSAFQAAGIGVNVIGVGALGSRVLRHVAELGVPADAFDDDLVEVHNTPNQVPGLKEVGQAKVDANRDILLRDTGIEIRPHQQRLDGSEVLRGVVFLCPDSMAARREIYEGAIKRRMDVPLFIECRMGVENGRVYVINPRKLAHLREYEKTLYTDEQASDRQTPVCGGTIAVGPTAEFIASCAVWQLIRWFAIVHKQAVDTLDNEILLCLRPLSVVTRCFE